MGTLIGSSANPSEDTLGKKWSMKQGVRMRQDRFFDTGEASGYPRQLTMPAHAAAGGRTRTKVVLRRGRHSRD